jgi:thioredoxin-related protein
MNKAYVFLLILAVASISTSAVSQDKKSTYRNSVISLKNLQSGERENLFKNNGRITITMIYQPDCTWCKKQGKMLKRLIDKCPEKVNLSLVGNKGNRRQLKRELKHFSKKLVAYQADKTFLRSIGGIAASPTTLFFNYQGKLLAKRRGYIKAKQFFAVVSQLTSNTCNI